MGWRGFWLDFLFGNEKNNDFFDWFLKKIFNFTPEKKIKNLQIMKKIFYLTMVFALFVGVLASCSGGGGRDDEPVGEEYFRFKMNGVPTSYSKDFHSTRRFVRSVNKHLTFTVVGYDRYKTENKPGPGLEISVTTGKDGKDITTGTYTAKGSSTDKGYDLSSNHFVTGFDSYGIHDGNFTLNIEVLTKTHAKGTFSGILGGGSDKMVITDGEFSVKLTRYYEVDN